MKCVSIRLSDTLTRFTLIYQSHIYSIYFAKLCQTTVPHTSDLGKCNDRLRLGLTICDGIRQSQAHNAVKLPFPLLTNCKYHHLLSDSIMQYIAQPVELTTLHEYTSALVTTKPLSGPADVLPSASFPFHHVACWARDHHLLHA